MVLWRGDIEKVKNKVEYTGWLSGIGMLGLTYGIIWTFLGISGQLLGITERFFSNQQLVLLGIFQLLSSVLFLTVRKEVIYLMFTVMFNMSCMTQTIMHFEHLHLIMRMEEDPLLFSTKMLLWSRFLITVTLVDWLCFAYLIYKYFDLKAEFRKYEKPYGHKSENVESEDVPYYYKVLGVSKDASQEEIKRAYYRLVRIYHPDVSADPEARRKFEEIRKAYEVLSDPEKRAKYDKFEHAYRSGRY